jgi:cysteine desulfurase/selenocysteine lyase
MNITQIRDQFSAIRSGRIVTNNAASSQLPDCLLDLYHELAPFYDNVHRGQSSSSKKITALFERSYEIIAAFIGARSWQEIILYRGTTEAINAVMYSLMTEFRNGDNVVTTYLEHNSNYVPWYAMTKEILPRFGINVECRLAKFDKETGELDIDHLAQLVDEKTKLVCCSGASNFLGTKPPLEKIRDIATSSGYVQPNGIKRSYLLIDGAQLVPNANVDVGKNDVDFLAWSFHKMFAPGGVGALYAKEEILQSMRPFQYGGDMIAEGQVTPEHVGYNSLPWKFTAGTPNILGSILAAGAIEFLIDGIMGISQDITVDTISEFHPERYQIERAMDAVKDYGQGLSTYLLEELSRINGLTIYGPKDPVRRTSLVSFNIKGKDPFEIANYLNQHGIESRAGCHCATLAHHFYGLTPPSSCRMSFYVYNNFEEMEAIVNAIKGISVERFVANTLAYK